MGNVSYRRKKYFALFNNILTVCLFLCILYFGIKTGQSFIKLLPTLITPFVMLLSSRVNRWTFIIGGCNSVIYSVGFFLGGLYGSALSALFVSAPLQFYSFFAWKKHAYKQATEFKKNETASRNISGNQFFCCLGGGLFYNI